MTLPSTNPLNPPGTTNGISAILIVYNEERVIERCLKSLQGVVDEIILLHDGECTDKTLEIARKYTTNIYVEPHTGESEMHKIKALQYAAYPWVLKIDADEFLSEGMRGVLRGLIEDRGCNAYLFLWPLWDGTRYISQHAPYKEVLFRKNAIYAVQFPHKTFSVNGVMKRVPHRLEHQPRYNNFSWATFQRKWIKWIKDQAVATIRHRQTHFYHCTEEQQAAFHRRMEQQIRLAHPLLAPGWFLLAFLKFIWRLKAWASPRLLQVAFFQGLYGAGLCYYLWQEKRQRRENP